MTNEEYVKEAKANLFQNFGVMDESLDIETQEEILHYRIYKMFPYTIQISPNTAKHDDRSGFAGDILHILCHDYFRHRVDRLDTIPLVSLEQDSSVCSMFHDKGFFTLGSVYRAGLDTLIEIGLDKNTVEKVYGDIVEFLKVDRP